MCPCHQTDRAYVYEQSVEKIEAEHTREAHKQYMELTGGAYCACVVGSNGYAGGCYEINYDVMNCIRCGCKNPVCVIRKQPRDLKKVNIFYDVRRTWITRLGFLEEKKVEITKGLKVFDHAVAQTDAEIWLKMKEHEASPLNNYAVIENPKKTPEDRRQEYFSKMHRQYGGQYDYFEFHYEVENIRIARSEQRDLLQDLLDKFAVVEIKVDARISEQDKQFCERQQAAYTAALCGFQELTFFWEDMLSAQKALLGEPDSPPRTYNQYLVPDGDDGPKITIQRHYEDIITQILSCFDGRTPSEQSLQELCRRCNEAVWCNYTHKAKFERKYAIISFLNSFCSFRNDKEYWTFTNSMKAILPCAAHFETGVLNEYPAFFPSPPFDGTYGCNQYDITGEDIFNAYTGIGGLHRLSQGDFSNYHEYSHLLVETNAYQTAILASTQQQLHGRWTLHHRG